MKTKPEMIVSQGRTNRFVAIRNGVYLYVYIKIKYQPANGSCGQGKEEINVYLAYSI